MSGPFHLNALLQSILSIERLKENHNPSNERESLGGHCSEGWCKIRAQRKAINPEEDTWIQQQDHATPAEPPESHS